MANTSSVKAGQTHRSESTAAFITRLELNAGKRDGSRYATNIMDLSLTHIHTSQKLNQLAECPKSVYVVARWKNRREAEDKDV